ncbi:peptidase [Streptococcus ferus]|uniref:peptidase n=1 Tax=Streptococcus ferus TaxID=1345 RepID=UPI0035168D7A
MAGETISYEPGKHNVFESDLGKIKDNFDDLVTELGNVKSDVSEHLEGKAATSLGTAIDDLVTKLTKEQENWQTVIDNANKIEELIKEADGKAAAGIEGNG